MQTIDQLFASLRGSTASIGSAGSGAAPTATADDCYFQLTGEPPAMAVNIVDRAGKVIDCSYEYAHGPIREALRALASIREHQAHTFSWDCAAGSDQVLIAEHDYLLGLLARSSRLVNARMQGLSLVETLAKVQLRLSDNESHYAAQLCLQTEDQTFTDFTMLSPAYAVAEAQRILPVAPLGPQFARLQMFAVTLDKHELEKYMTLLFSTFENVTPVLEGYQLVSGALRHAKACVIFEDIDNVGCLKLRVSSCLDGYEPDFCEDYGITRAAVINTLERRIIVSDVMYQDNSDCLRSIRRALKKTTGKDNNGFFQEDNFFLIETETVEPFLAEALPTLLSQYQCYGAEHLQRYKLRTSRPKLKMKSISSGIGFLQTEVQLEFGDQSISLEKALRYLRTQTYIPLNDGSRALINSDYIRKLERLFHSKGKTMQISFFDLPFLDELIEQNERHKIDGLDSVTAIFHQLTTPRKFDPPPINAQLRPYQQTGYEWLRRLHAAGLGGCLADDMGLGKTVQALALLRATVSDDSLSSLIVMPKSLLFNWQNEIARFTPELTCHIYHGSGRDLEAARQAKLILTTYATLRSDIEQLKDLPFNYLVLDESQNIKNPASQASKAVLLLQSRYRLALSGTPVENNLSELYSLFRVLNPSMFGSLAAFNRDYAGPISRDNDKQAMADLRAKIAPFILRRSKRQVLQELPDKVEQVQYVQMSDAQAALYENRRRFYQALVNDSIASDGLKNSQFMLLQAFTELRQLASTPESKTDNAIVSPKREMVVAEIIEAAGNGHKSLLFANFIGALEGLSEDLEAAGVKHLVMTGATGDRESLVRRFQNDDSIKVFLLTLKTGGVGLNLTAAEYVFIYDPWWNRAAETQAIDRCHRIGQKNTVFTYKMVMRNTIEEKILLLQQRKRDLCDNLIGADHAALQTLSEDDIRFALGEE